MPCRVLGERIAADILKNHASWRVLGERIAADILKNHALASARRAYHRRHPKKSLLYLITIGRFGAKPLSPHTGAWVSFGSLRIPA